MSEEQEFAYFVLDRLESLLGTAEAQALRTDLEIAELTGSALLTNLPNYLAPVVTETAVATGFNIYIEPQAFDRAGQIIPDCIAVYTKDIYKDQHHFGQPSVN